jgi:3-oxoacyl-[acyl-carrier-protein] synthase III
MTTMQPIVPPARRGVRIAGTGSALPDRRMTNADLMKVMDTSDEWIVQRTGIRERRRIDTEKGESTKTLSADALKAALADAKLDAKDLDLILLATMTEDMPCPPTACLVADMVGTKRCGAMDINGACSGFVYAMNIAHDLIRCGSYNTIAVIGADCLSTLMDYSDKGRGTAILFGDAAGAAILRATDDTSRGIIAQSMHADGTGWKEIYVPMSNPRDFPPGVEIDGTTLGRVHMNGSNVFKFAVGTFPLLIEETLKKAGVSPADVGMYVCHQSNQRILHAARDRFGLSDDKLHINIDRVGNTVSASVPLVLDECRKAGRIRENMLVMFLGFGAGLTWASSLWRV